MEDQIIVNYQAEPIIIQDEQVGVGGPSKLQSELSSI